MHAIILSALVSISVSFDDWSALDVSLESAFAATVVVDVLQTRYFTTGGRCCEGNPLLPALPSRGTMYAIAIGAPLAHAMVSHMLPAWGPRTWWQLTFISAEVMVVRNNYRWWGFNFAF